MDDDMGRRWSNLFFPIRFVCFIFIFTFLFDFDFFL